MPIILQLALLLLAQSADAPSPADHNAKLIQFLTDSLATAPPEIEAHCLLRIAGSGKASAASAKNLVESAFLLAGSAVQSVPGVSAVSAARWLGESDAAIISSAGVQQVDALSLKCRAVKSMLQLSAPRAREMFDLQCQQPVVPTLYVPTSISTIGPCSKCLRRHSAQVSERTEQMLRGCLRT